LIASKYQDLPINRPLRMASSLSEFDYVIVGGGTSGLVIASRLSENPDLQVLVIEAGEDHVNDPRVSMPAGWPALLGSDCDWNFGTIPQVRLQSGYTMLQFGENCSHDCVKEWSRRKDHCSTTRSHTWRFRCNQCPGFHRSFKGRH